MDKVHCNARRIIFPQFSEQTYHGHLPLYGLCGPGTDDAVECVQNGVAGVHAQVDDVKEQHNEGVDPDHSLGCSYFLSITLRIR